jgi:hypothetical protein
VDQHGRTINLQLAAMGLQDVTAAGCSRATPRPDPDLVLLPARLHSLSLTEPSVVQAILKRIGNSSSGAAAAVKALRAASKLLRRTVNNTVESLAIQLHEQCHYTWNGTQQPRPLELASDLGATFPQAAKLDARLMHASGPLELAHSLTGLPKLCPSLVRRLQTLELQLQATHLESHLCLMALNQLLSA